jgi:ditrans,polycis-polyprenyl diphosphate synthase
MNMAKVKLEQLSEHGALLDRYGASIRILGQRNLVKPDVLAAVDKAVALTAHNKRYVYKKHYVQSLANMATSEPFSTFAFLIPLGKRSPAPSKQQSRHIASRSEHNRRR